MCRLFMNLWIIIICLEILDINLFAFSSVESDWCEHRGTNGSFSITTDCQLPPLNKTYFDNIYYDERCFPSSICLMPGDILILNGVSTITGNLPIISRRDSFVKYRFFTILENGKLTLQNLKLRGGALPLESDSANTKRGGAIKLDGVVLYLFF